MSRTTSRVNCGKTKSNLIWEKIPAMGEKRYLTPAHDEPAPPRANEDVASVRSQSRDVTYQRRTNGVVPRQLRQREERLRSSDRAKKGYKGHRER